MNVIDMHCDTIAQIYRTQNQKETQRLLSNNLCIDLQKMKQGGYLLQNFAMFVDKGEEENPLETALGMIDCYYQELNENNDWIAPVFSYEDIVKNQKNGKMSAMLTLEEGCSSKRSAVIASYVSSFRCTDDCADLELSKRNWCAKSYYR